jgi:hypothetical protein
MKQWSVSKEVSYRALEGVLNTLAKQGYEIYAIIQNPRRCAEVTVIAYCLENGSHTLEGAQAADPSRNWMPGKFTVSGKQPIEG